MLTPEYLLHISEAAEEIAEELHQDILNRIIERIMMRLDRGDKYILTAYDKWQLEVLQDAGVLSEDIIKEISKKTKLLEKEIAEAYEEAGVKSYGYDSEIYEASNIFSEPLEQSPHYIRMMQRNYEKTLSEMRNFTGTLANAAQQSFIQGCDKAYNLVLSGVVGYSQAVKEVVNDIVKDGVVVHYPSGHTDTIETATLRAVRTGVSQAAADITTARMDEYDWDIVLVTAHLGARVTDKEDFTNHYWWQGKFYSRSGKDKRFKPFSVCNEGHVQGICGANCRHSYMPGDGEFNPFEEFDSEENKKAYETEQRQRLLERRIRKTKREVMGLKTARDNATSDAAKAELDLEYQRKAALLQKQNKAYNDFCEQNGLKKLRDRIDVARWGRKQAAAARGAAKSWKNRKKAKQTGGGFVDYDKREEKRETQAAEYYEKIKQSDDVHKIAESSGFTEEEIRTIKEHVFFNTHILYDGIGYFAPDYNMAVAWKRLASGVPQPRDILLLRHELLESSVEKMYNLTASEAHTIAKKEFNWEDAVYDLFGDEGEPDGLL